MAKEKQHFSFKKSFGGGPGTVDMGKEVTVRGKASGSTSFFFNILSPLPVFHLQLGAELKI